MSSPLTGGWKLERVLFPPPPVSAAPARSSEVALHAVAVLGGDVGLHNNSISWLMSSPASNNNLLMAVRHFCPGAGAMGRRCNSTIFLRISSVRSWQFHAAEDLHHAGTHHFMSVKGPPVDPAENAL